MLGQTLSLASLGALGSLAYMWFSGRSNGANTQTALAVDSRITTPVVPNVSAAMAAGSPQRMLVLLHFADICDANAAALDAWPALHARAAAAGAPVGFAAVNIGDEPNLFARLAPTKLPAYAAIHCKNPGNCFASDLVYGATTGSAFVENALQAGTDWTSLELYPVPAWANIVGALQMRLFYHVFTYIAKSNTLVRHASKTHPILLCTTIGIIGIVLLFVIP